MAFLRPLEGQPVCLDEATAVSQCRRVHQGTHGALLAMLGLRCSVQTTLALLPAFLLMRRVWCAHLLLLPCLLSRCSMTGCPLCVRLQVLISSELKPGVMEGQLSAAPTVVKHGMESIF